VPVRAGGEFRLGKNRVLQAFPTSHGGSEPTLGYAVLEERRRLKPEYSGRSEHEIRDLVRQGGRDDLMEAYRHVRFAHTGDAMPIDPALVSGADLLMHDGTFLDAETGGGTSTPRRPRRSGWARPPVSRASSCTTSRFVTSAPRPSQRFAPRSHRRDSPASAGSWTMRAWST